MLASCTFKALAIGNWENEDKKSYGATSPLARSFDDPIKNLANLLTPVYPHC